MKSLLATVDEVKDKMNKADSKDGDVLLPREDDDPDRLGFDGNYLKPKIESDIWQQFEDHERLRNKDNVQTHKEPQEDLESRSRNSLSLFQDALSISPPPEEIDLTDAIKTVLNKNDWYVVPCILYFYTFIYIHLNSRTHKCKIFVHAILTKYCEIRSI